MARILEWSERHWGEAAADRYAELLFQAMRDVAEDPFRVGSKALGYIDENARFYHMKHSKSRVEDPVDEPRHFVVYEPASDGVDILGFFYDGIPMAIGLRRVLGDQ